MASVRENTSTRVIRMIFILEDGKTLTYNLKNPKTPAPSRQVTAQTMAAMSTYIRKGNVTVSDIKDAYIYETNKLDLE